MKVTFQMEPFDVPTHVTLVDSGAKIEIAKLPPEALDALVINFKDRLYNAWRAGQSVKVGAGGADGGKAPSGGAGGASAPVMGGASSRCGGGGAPRTGDMVVGVGGVGYSGGVTIGPDGGAYGASHADPQPWPLAPKPAPTSEPFVTYDMPDGFRMNTKFHDSYSACRNRDYTDDELIRAKILVPV